MQQKLSARDRLLQAAAALFYGQGIHRTGIDAVVLRAGVAKKSLYNNFASKSDLVDRYLEARHAEWLALYETRRASAETPTQRVLAVFDAYRDHAERGYEDGFRGCGLLNAAAEFGAHNPARQTVRRQKEEVEAILADHLAAFPDPQGMARQLAFLLEGAMVRAGLEGDSACITAARDIASGMLAAR